MKRIIYFFIPIVIILSSFVHISVKGPQRASYNCSVPLNIDTTLFEFRKGQTYFYFDKSLEPKELKLKNFVWLVDTPKNYFTAYLINTSDSTFDAEIQDGSLIMIQEAMDERGAWNPVEYWVNSDCMYSYFHPLKLDSGKYVMIPIKKYTGSFKTKFRLKMKKNKSIFYSETFDGSIEKSQFEICPSPHHDSFIE